MVCHRTLALRLRHASQAMDTWPATLDDELSGGLAASRLLGAGASWRSRDWICPSESRVPGGGDADVMVREIYVLSSGGDCGAT